MTNTTTELLTVNGVSLNDLAKNVESLTGRLRVAPRKGTNVAVPGRHGTLRRRSLMHDENIISLPIWVAGCDADGAVPGGSSRRQQFYANVDRLTRLFTEPGVLSVRHTLPDGSIREALCDLLDLMDFSTQAHNEPVGLVNVDLTMAQPFFRATTDSVSSFVDPTLPSTVTLAEFAGSTAPIDDLNITIVGPVTNPKVEAYFNGVALDPPVSFQINGTISAGHWAVIDCNNWTVAWTHATNIYSVFEHTGRGRFLELQPGTNQGANGPQVRLSGTGKSSSTNFVFQGRKKFLVG